MLFLCWLMVALGASPEQVEARLAEVAPLRAQRIEANAPVMDPANIRKAAGGTIVTGLEGRRAWGVAVLNVPIGKLWAGLNDETHAKALDIMRLYSPLVEVVSLAEAIGQAAGSGAALPS